MLWSCSGSEDVFVADAVAVVAAAAVDGGSNNNGSDRSKRKKIVEKNRFFFEKNSIVRIEQKLSPENSKNANGDRGWQNDRRSTEFVINNQPVGKACRWLFPAVDAVEWDRRRCLVLSSDSVCIMD